MYVYRTKKIVNYLNKHIKETVMAKKNTTKQAKKGSNSKEHHDSGLRHLAVVAILAILSLLLMVKSTNTGFDSVANDENGVNDLYGEAINSAWPVQKTWLYQGQELILKDNSVTLLSAEKNGKCNIKVNEDVVWLEEQDSHQTDNVLITVIGTKTDVSSPGYPTVCLISYK